MKKSLQKCPKFYCETCLKFQDNNCALLKRHVLGDYNRCFYHSNYSPFTNVVFLDDKNEKKVCHG